MRSWGVAAAVVAGMLVAGCSSGATDDESADDSATATAGPATPPPSLEDAPESSAAEYAPSDPPLGGATTIATDPAAEEPDGDRTTGQASDLLPVVSLFYAGEVVTGDVERDLGELTRCVADERGAPPDAVGTLDPDHDPAALVAALDPGAVAAITTAMDTCISPAVLLSDAFLSGSIDREQHLQARCLIDTVGDTIDWADVVADRSDDTFPFGGTTEAEAECSEPPGAGSSLTSEEEAIADSLEELAGVAGFELTGDEIRCILVGSRGTVDLGLTVDLTDLDLDALAPVLETFDTCVPLGGVLAEFDQGAIVYSICLDQALAGSIGWYELAEFGARAEELTDEQIAAEPLILTVDTARSQCHWSEPGEVLVELGEVLNTEVLVYDGTRLWAGGVDEHGGANPGNVLVLDGASGAVMAAIETEPFSVEIIASDRDDTWIASMDGESIQRIHAADGTVETPVELPGRAVGDLQLTTDALWATDNIAGTLLRLDRTTGEILDEIAIAPGEWFSSDLAYAAEWLWLTNREDPIVRQLDPLTGALVAEHAVESEFTMHLLDLVDAVGVYGFSQLWRIDPEDPEPEQLIDNFGQEDLDVDAAAAVGELIAFADEDVSTLAIYNPRSRFIEEMQFFPGLVESDRDRITTNGTTIWLTNFNNQLVRINRL